MAGSDFKGAFDVLKPVLGEYAERMAVQTDTPGDYSIVTKTPSPFPQHKGQPMWFGAVRMGKAYVSFHLMPLYMCPPLQDAISPALKQRMQGKTCFNFKAVPDPGLLSELKSLTAAAVTQWAGRHWL